MLSDMQIAEALSRCHILMASPQSRRYQKRREGMEIAERLEKKMKRAGKQDATVLRSAVKIARKYPDIGKRLLKNNLNLARAKRLALLEDLRGGKDLYIVVQTEPWMFKIGQAGYPEERFATLTGTNPAPIYLALVAEGQGDQEHHLHRHLADFRVPGRKEWFYGEGLNTLPTWVLDPLMKALDSGCTETLFPGDILGAIRRKDPWFSNGNHLQKY